MLKRTKKVRNVLLTTGYMKNMGYHIGSTSVLSLSAKPIIDIMVAVRSLEEVDAASNDFISIGYEYMGEFGIVGRRYLRKGGDERTHQVHIFSADDKSNIIRHLAFRDYLRRHPDVAYEYGILKKQLAIRFPYDIEGYSDGKDEFVKKIEEKALAEYDDSWDRLYIEARKVQGERKISSLLEAGDVSAAILTQKGNIYTGVSIDSACSLGMCAERNAISTMITNGESEIKKLVAIMPDGKAGMPCGACREILTQLGHASSKIEILLDYESKESVKLEDLVPLLWHSY